MTNFWHSFKYMCVFNFRQNIWYLQATVPMMTSYSHFNGIIHVHVEVRGDWIKILLNIHFGFRIELYDFYK